MTATRSPSARRARSRVKVKPERPVGLFQEYWRDEEGTAGSFVGDWYLTGDKAYKDEDGYHWFVGRADDVIISAGYRIGPFEVESALIEHPAVAESAVVASPDPVRGEIVKALRHPRPRLCPLRRTRPQHPGSCPDHHRALQVPPFRRVRNRATQNRKRQNPPRRAPRNGTRTLPHNLTLFNKAKTRVPNH